MLFVDNEDVVDPRLNLAIEEHLLRNVQTDEPILLFYVNEPSVIIGRNQNSIEEIDPGYIESNGIHVVRRLSGGGAVYHDLGNLNFSFVTSGRQDLHNFSKFTAPVVELLRSRGVDATVSGSSDIFASGKKISGNAQYAAAGRMFSHGTLLFDTNLEHMLRALNPRQAVIESKAVQSIRNFVTNIRELLPEDSDIPALKEMLLQAIFGAGPINRLPLQETDWLQIGRIRDERYDNWDWNYGRAPQFNIQKSDRFGVGKIDARIEVIKGKIASIRIFGDFAGNSDISGFESRLTGVRFRREALSTALNGIEIDAYFGPIEPAELLDLLSPTGS